MEGGLWQFGIYRALTLGFSDHAPQGPVGTRLRGAGWVLVLASDGAACTMLMAEVRGGWGTWDQQDSFIKPSLLRDKGVGRRVE